MTRVALLLLAAGVWGGLTMTPPDYLQGETVRILYIHVPAAWLGKHTFAIEPSAALAANRVGSGFAAVTVLPTGIIRASGGVVKRALRRGQRSMIAAS